MRLFFADDIKNDIAIFSQEEAKHATKVLRKKEGDSINITDGRGKIFDGLIIELSKRKMLVRLEKILKEEPLPRFKLHLAIAPTKNIGRFEWFLEKATEIGITDITPIFCSNSERKKVRIDRFEKIILSACKQSLKLHFPTLHPPAKFSDFIKKNQGDNHYIAWCDYENNTHLKEIYNKGNDATILIGPEGDFSSMEVEMAKELGYQAIGLGKNRLRTETAGIVACHTIQLLNE